MNDALTYLFVRSVRNGLVVRLRRIRQPRYLLIALGLGIYLFTVVFNRPPAGIFRIPSGYESLAQLAVAVIAGGFMSLAWILPSGAAFHFTPAEVQFLFCAPVTRRQLLGFKMMRLLVAPLGSATFITVVAGPGRLGAAVVFALKTTLFFAVIGLHEAGVSLYRANRKSEGPLSARRRLPVVASAVALIAATSALLATVAFASGPALLQWLPVVALLAAGIVVWILRSDTAFEEEAAINAEKARAAIAHGRPLAVTLPPQRTASFALAPRGPAETAILWKNWLLFERSSGISRRGRIVRIVLYPSLVVAAGFVLDGIPVGLLGLVGAVMLTVLGPMMMRKDLRHDLVNLALLKTWPVRGVAIFRGELLAPAIALSGAAAIGLVAAGVFTPSSVMPIPWTPAARAGFVLGAVVASSALIVAQLVIQNGIVVVFPAWAGPTAATGGVEMMGMNMVAMYGGLLALAVASVFPGAVAAGVMLLAGGTMLPALAFALVLLGECYAATEILGRVLERTDLQDLG